MRRPKNVDAEDDKGREVPCAEQDAAGRDGLKPTAELGSHRQSTRSSSSVVQEGPGNNHFDRNRSAAEMLARAGSASAHAKHLGCGAT